MPAVGAYWAASAAAAEMGAVGAYAWVATAAGTLAAYPALLGSSPAKEWPAPGEVSQ